MFQPYNNLTYHTSSSGHRRLKRLFIYSIGKIIWYILLSLCFFVGYFFGLLQSTDKLCIDYSHSKETTALLASAKYDVTLLVTIFSAPANLKRRHVIRNTWFLTKNNNDVKCFFIIGTGSLSPTVLEDLKKEVAIHNDIILLPEIDDAYSKLSKKLLEMIKEIDRDFLFTFMLKVDDDTFVRLDAVQEQLAEKPTKRLYWGFFDGRARVKTKGKWVEENWNLCSTYLPYAKGGGYALSSDLVRYIAQNSALLSLYKNEDVSLGVWLSALDIKRIHDPNFDTEFESRGCFNTYLVTHKQSESMMEEKYQNLLNLGNMCASEHRKRLSYIYNWNALPHLCCVRNDTRIP